MNRNEPAILCSHLERSFGGKVALRDCSLRIPQGAVFALVGSNGAGKTSLLRILAGLLSPTGGKATVLGRDVSEDPLWVKERIGFASSEERSFYWRLTGRQNLDFFGALHNISSGARKTRIDELFAVFELNEMAGSRFREYSTGMKQALGLMRALLHDPPVLLLDEPTRSLSPDLAARAREIIRKKADNEGKTVMIASHNLSEVEKLADEIAVLHRGSITASGTLPELASLAGASDSGDLDAVFHHFTR